MQPPEDPHRHPDGPGRRRAGRVRPADPQRHQGHLELRADAPRCPAADPRPERKHGDLARRSLQASFRADEGILIPARSDYISRCVGIGRRGGLKIHNAVSYHFGVNP